MNVFLSHSSKYDYEKELYQPIKKYFKNTDYLFFLPEEKKTNTKEVIKNTDVFFCEISYTSSGVGIETGWADAFDKPIFCFHKKGVKSPSSFKYITNEIYEYGSLEELLDLMQIF